MNGYECLAVSIAAICFTAFITVLLLSYRVDDD